MKFINGFKSYRETYFQFATMIQHFLDSLSLEDYEKIARTNTIVSTKEYHGFASLEDLCHEWTVEFEKEHKGEEWIELDWYDTLEEFFMNKNK